MYDATSVTIVSTRQAPASAVGSVGVTPNRKARSERPMASDSGTPTISAIAASLSASPTTIRRMVPRSAPNARRRPISRVRRLTVYASVP
jgi:hypothetical protein